MREIIDYNLSSELLSIEQLEVLKKQNGESLLNAFSGFEREEINKERRMINDFIERRRNETQKEQ